MLETEGTVAFTTEPPKHQPRRDDDVAVWLRRKRDVWDPDHPAEQANWAKIDHLLTVYCMKADYGLRLDQDGGDP